MKSLYNRITSSAQEFAQVHHRYLAAGLLAVMFGLGFGSMLGNSAIVDEVAHLPAAYSYLHYGDYRLNPEHPPLIKDLAGLPLQFMPLEFPDNLPAWTMDVNGQWQTGWDFLYHVGNNADEILFWSRLPILLLALGFGVWLYWFSRRRWGTAAALLVLFFYALSPNILAHSSLVTTDLGATVFIFLALASFARFAAAPTRANLLWLSLALAAAQVAKFSAVLLYPLLGVFALLVAGSVKRSNATWERVRQLVGGFLAASGLSVVWIWLFYVPHTWNMSTAVQDHLIAGSLVSDNLRGVSQWLMSLNDVSLFKPLVQYMLGLTMVFGRVAGGNVTYFNGEVSNGSYKWYFPELFAVKTQVALLLLIAIAVGWVLWRLSRRTQTSLWVVLKEHFRTHVLEWLLGSFAVFYFLVSVAGNLNLGIRHILPVYVPLFVVIAIATVRLCRHLVRTRWRVWTGLGLIVLLGWYGGSTVAAYPSYLSYFNEVIGGSDNADKYFSDSSVDWGQDLKRLKTYVAARPEISHIAIDYFGGGIPAYYFCHPQRDARGDETTAAGYDCNKSVMEEWHSQNGVYTGQYIAVSETFLQNDRYYAEVNGTPGYDYLRSRTPIAKVGGSIYVYKLY